MSGDSLRVFVGERVTRSLSLGRQPLKRAWLWSCAGGALHVISALIETLLSSGTGFAMDTCIYAMINYEVVMGTVSI